MPKLSHKSLLSYWKCIELVFACRSCVNLAQIASYFDASHEMGQDNKILFSVACKVALFGLARCTCGVNGIVTKWERLPHSSSRSLTHGWNSAFYHFFFPALFLYHHIFGRPEFECWHHLRVWVKRQKDIWKNVAFVTFAILTRYLILQIPGPLENKPLCTDPNGFDPHPTDCQK